VLEKSERSGGIEPRRTAERRFVNEKESHSSLFHSRMGRAIKDRTSVREEPKRGRGVRRWDSRTKGTPVSGGATEGGQTPEVKKTKTQIHENTIVAIPVG